MEQDSDNQSKIEKKIHPFLVERHAFDKSRVYRRNSLYVEATLDRHGNYDYADIAEKLGVC